VSVGGDVPVLFPWFGGKSRAEAEVSAAMGEVSVYCEPFAGSLGVLLQREPAKHEVVNDADGWIVNFWRALAASPDEVARWADWPVTEADLTARHLWLVERAATVREALQADAEWYDAKAAGWWVWGICAWIGSGWCSGSGPWVREGEGDDARVVRGAAGVHRQLPHLGNAGRGVHRQGAALKEWMGEVSARLRHVRVACGDWSRVVTPAVLQRRGGGYAPVGVLLDPPYPAGWDTETAYAGQGREAGDLWREVTAWAAAEGEDRRMRIVVCGYEGLWEPPPGWTVRRWQRKSAGLGGNGRQPEVLWCSPGCVAPVTQQGGLFGTGYDVGRAGGDRER
jgi:hypothetical protein